MSAEKKEREPLFSPKNMKLLKEPLSLSNPITVQVLGICSALAVTAKLKPAVVMTLSVIVVMASAKNQNYCSAGCHRHDGNPCRPGVESICV